jgi:hypothetical protein
LGRAIATADKCCVDQNNLRGFLEGGLRDVVLSSEKMVAFLGPNCACAWPPILRKQKPMPDHYALSLLCADCTRLWCIYELATFCKVHQEELSERLLLLSIDWAPSHSLFKDPELTREEKEALRDFRCRDARCFKPADRAYVLEAIRSEWGTEEAFDKYVQTELPKILAASKRAYSQRFVRVLQSNLEHMFGD